MTKNFGGKASCEKLTKKIQKEKPYSFKHKGHKVQHGFNEKVKETFKTAVEALSVENFQVLDKVTTIKKAINKDIELLESRQKLIKLADQSE